MNYESDMLSMTVAQFQAIGRWQYHPVTASNPSPGILEVEFREHDGLGTAGWTYLRVDGEHLATIQVVKSKTRKESYWPHPPAYDYIVRWFNPGIRHSMSADVVVGEEVFEHATVMPGTDQTKGARGYAAMKAQVMWDLHREHLNQKENA